MYQQNLQVTKARLWQRVSDIHARVSRSEDGLARSLSHASTRIDLDEMVGLVATMETEMRMIEAVEETLREQA
jgi:hypothetical protein